LTGGGSLCFELGLPLISARVIYSGATSAKNIGEGFYPLACELKPEYKSMEPIAVWKNELKLIRECDNWERLKKYLDGVSETTTRVPITKQIESNPFAKWLNQNTSLADSSIIKYAGAVGTISREIGDCSLGYDD